jgi:hypothetical protein
LSPAPGTSGDRIPQTEAIEGVQIEDPATSLLIQLVAFGQKADVIMRSRIEAARNIIRGERKQARSRELRIALGSVLLGAFAQGFTYEVSLATPRPFWITIYVVAGFVGLFLVLWGH